MCFSQEKEREIHAQAYNRSANLGNILFNAAWICRRLSCETWRKRDQRPGLNPDLGVTEYTLDSEMKTRIGKREWALLAFIIIYSFIPTFGGLVRVVELLGGPAIAPNNPRALAAPFPIVAHILSSFVFCILGASQFLPNLRRGTPKLHRGIGRLVAAAGLTSALTGLWMTLTYPIPEALQGDALYWVRIVLSLAMAALIIYGIVTIRARQPLEHGAAMLRAYAIGQGASTQTVLGIAWMIAFGTEALGPLRDGLMITSWVLNLLIAEVLIRKFVWPKNRTARTLSPSRARQVRSL